MRIEPYDNQWALEYDAEAGRILRECDGLDVRLEHIGSTSVPGLAARPIIDIMAGCAARTPRTPYVAAFRRLGYEHLGAYGIPGRDYFRRGVPRTHHVHLVAWSSAFWRDHLAFRDYLRAHPAAAREYAALKRELAGSFPDDPRRYSQEKGPFIRAIVRSAIGPKR